MIKHKLIINGTQTIDSTSLTGFTLTESVNEGQDLTLGSVCSAMIEFSVRLGKGLTLPQYGDKIELYESDGGEFEKHGVFFVENTKRKTDTVYSVRAFDSVSKLDKDITDWLKNVQFPMSLYNFTKVVVEECGLVLKNASIKNGDYEVKKFLADRVKARTIMKWVGEICSNFCHADYDGNIEFSWYSECPVEISYERTSSGNTDVSYDNGNLSISGNTIVANFVTGNLSVDSDNISKSYDQASGNLGIVLTAGAESVPYYMGSFDREAYSTKPIQKVQIKFSRNDVGTIFPNVAENVNTYQISENYLMTAESANSLVPIAESIYNSIKGVSYTPAKVSIPADFRVKVGQYVTVKTREKSYTVFVMRKSQSGSKDVITCVGNQVRYTTTRANSQSFTALSGRITDLQTDAEGIRANISHVEEKVDDGISTVSKHIADINARADGIETRVSETQQDVGGIKTDLTDIKQTSTKIEASVKNIEENGLDFEKKVIIDKNGLTVQQNNQTVKTTIDYDGMYVNRYDEVMLRANKDGVLATDVTVRNYLIVGDHARFEDYLGNRTACFWI